LSYIVFTLYLYIIVEVKVLKLLDVYRIFYKQYRNLNSIFTHNLRIKKLYLIV